MTLWGKDQLNDVRDEVLFQLRGERVLVKLPVQLCSALVEERVGTLTNDVVVSVVGMAIRGGTEGASKKRQAFERGGCFLGGVVPHCPVPLVEELLVVASGALRTTRQV